MNKEKVGTVTEEEKKEIEKLFERKLALNELLFTVNSPVLSSEEKDGLYEKVVADLGKTKKLFDEWWMEMSQKYSWKAAGKAKWSIDFNTNEIFLVTSDS